MGQGVEIGTELVLSSRRSLDSLMRGTGFTAPTRRLSPEESQSGEPDGTNGKNSTPLQGLIFSKAMSTVMDNLGIDLRDHRKQES